MLMDEIRVPQARHWALPLLVSAALFTWSFTRENATSWVLIVMAIAGVFGFWFLVNLIVHLSAVFGDERRKDKELDYKFSPNFMAETIARMNETQIRVIRAGRNIIEIMPGESGPVEKLFGEEVYLYTAWYILVKSAEYRVYPIHNFQSGTFHFDVLGDHAVDDYQQARNFHRWLYQNGYGMWGKGNTSMTWTKGWNAQKVMQSLGLDEDTYDDE